MAKELIEQLAKSLFFYCDSARHKREFRGGPPLITVASCGAFRRWKMFAVKGRVVVEIDAYDFRDRNRKEARVYVATGVDMPKILLTPDDSRSHHSLEVLLSPGSSLVDVTNEPDMWAATAKYMIEELDKAYERLVKFETMVAEENKKRKEAARKAAIAAARECMELGDS